MAKQSGLGDALFIDGVDISGDINSIDEVSGPLATLEVTGIDKSAMERIGGLRDGKIGFTAYFNPTAGKAHSTFRGLPLTDRAISYCRGLGLGAPVASMIAKQLNYDPKRGDDGAFTFGVEAVANGYGVEWGEQLTPGKRTDGSATNGSSLDAGASTAFGLQAYVHVFAFTGTSATIKLQDSPDNSVWTDVTGGSFGALSAVGSARLQTGRALTVARYLRVATTGTFTNVVFTVQGTRNGTTVNF